ncbi:DUF4910 domain-containing protein [bacterium]|nr:DUF4910 domain-containing protein [bacterium]
MIPGTQMHDWAKDLYPICRSLTGSGVRQTLSYIQNLLPGLSVLDIPTGTRVMDWTVPDEWNIREAWIEDPFGERIIDFKNCNLHVVGYSEPINKVLSLQELQDHLFSLPRQPNAIPYVTSYYKRSWGFCICHIDRLRLKDGNYRVYIDSDFRQGVLNYAEIILPGSSRKEVLLSTYVCHPSMANNELSGPVVTTAIAQWLQQLSNRRYTYRIVFIPETIGSLVYLSQNLAYLKENVVAGFNITCIGDDRSYSYLPSRSGNTLSDQVAKHVLSNTDSHFISYNWLDRGSDERQYCAPGIDLPIASIMRSKYGEYPEYHTSLDDLSFITPSGLHGGFLALKRSLEIIEKNMTPIVTTLGEPQLGRRGLYPNISTKEKSSSVRLLMNLLTYSDGTNTLLDIANLLNTPFWLLLPLAQKLMDYNLVTVSEHTDSQP